MKRYSITERSWIGMDGTFEGEFFISYFGLTHLQKMELERRIASIAEFFNQKEEGISTTMGSPLAKKTFTAWQRKYVVRLAEHDAVGATDKEICHMFRKRFHGAKDISDSQILSLYRECSASSKEEPVVSHPTESKNEEMKPPLESEEKDDPPKVQKPKKPLIAFTIGDKVRYSKGNPAYPTKTGAVTDAPNGTKMCVQFGINDRKWVLKSDYEKVEPQIPGGEV